jgi:hypothetical protein
MYLGLMKTLWTEGKRWHRKFPGLGGDTWLIAAMNALLLASAANACQMLSEEDDAICKAGQTRQRRLLRALSQATWKIIESEGATGEIRGHA